MSDSGYHFAATTRHQIGENNINDRAPHIGERVAVEEEKRRAAMALPQELYGFGEGSDFGDNILAELPNVIDRVIHGAVADFFYFHLGEHYWPAFNVADAGICLGVALLLLESMLCRK